MKKLIVFFILFSSIRLCAAGFDDMILWHYNLPAQSNSAFSLAPLDISQRGFKTFFLHSDPYRISALNWNYVAFKYGLAKWGIYGQARFYGLDNLYTNNSFALGGVIRPRQYIAFAVSANRQREDFKGIANYNRFDLDAKISGVIGSFTGGVDVDHINLKRNYNFDGATTPEPMVYGSLGFDNDFRLTVAAKRLYTRHTRWFFNQSVTIVDGLDLQLGYISNPNVFNWGLDMNWKSFTLNFTYFAMSRLNDTMALGLSIAM